MAVTSGLRVEAREDGWVLAGEMGHPQDLGLCNDYLGYLADRHYAPGTRRSYAFDLLGFARWLAGEQLRLDAVDTAAVLRFLSACRGEGLAPATTNRRLAAISGLFAFRSMRDPAAVNPMPTGAAARRTSGSARDGLLGHLARPQPRSAVRVRQSRRLPRGLDRVEVAAFLESLRAWRDRAIAGLMLFSGLRSAEVLALGVCDVDIGGGWVRVCGKGSRERRVPIDAEVGGWVQAYLLAERPDTEASALFVVAKGPHRGLPLTPFLQWGWPAAPTRTLIFPRDIPPLPHPLPRYLPPDDDRRLTTITSLASRLDNITQALDAVAAKVRRQEEEIRSLKRAIPQPARRSPQTD